MASQQFTKMMLVPEKAKAMKLHNQMKTAVNRPTNVKTDKDMMRNLQQKVIKYLSLFRKLRGTPISQPSRPETQVPRQATQHYSTAVEAPSEQQLNDMVAAITQRPDILDVNMRGELVYRGMDVPGSNILDLIAGGGEDQQLFQVGVREVQEAQRPPSQHSNDFEGFSFYNDGPTPEPPMTSTPLNRSMEQHPPLPIDEQLSDDELPDPIPIQSLRRRPATLLNAVHATDPRNSAVKTRPGELIVKRRHTAAAKVKSARQKQSEARRQAPFMTYRRAMKRPVTIELKRQGPKQKIMRTGVSPLDAERMQRKRTINAINQTNWSEIQVYKDKRR